MNNIPSDRQVEDQIFANIQSGKIKMRPRWFFIFQTVLAIVAGTVLFVSIVFLGVFIAFIQRESGAGLAISYGVSGWYVFFKSLPWTLIFTAIVFIILLSIIARRYAFVYQRPAIYALMGIVVIVVLVSLVISVTPLYPVFFTPGAPPQEFLINGLYQYETSPMASVHRGEVTLIANNGFLLQNLAGETSTVIFAPGTAFDPSVFRAGDRVVVFGARTGNGIIEAFGVQKL